MAIDYTALAVELAGAHPLTGVYSAVAQTAADELNAINISVEKNTLPTEAADATDATEFNALPEADKNLWVGVLGWATINLNIGIGLATAQGIWAGSAGTITRPALIATSTKLVSRTSEIKIGVVVVKHHHVANARGEL